MACSDTEFEWLAQPRRDCLTAGWDNDEAVALEVDRSSLVATRYGVSAPTQVPCYEFGIEDGTVGLSRPTTAIEIYDGTETIDQSGVVEDAAIPRSFDVPSDNGGMIPVEQYGEKSRKALVIAHGGPVNQHFCSYHHDLQAFAAAGWTVFAPQFRGSIGRGRDWLTAAMGDPGGVAVTDLLTVRDQLRQRGYNSIAIYGGSWGGYLALMAAVRDCWTATVALCAPTHLRHYVESSESGLTEALVRHIGGTPDDYPDRYRRRSPAERASDISNPTLLVHGEDDNVVPVDQSKQMASALKQTASVFG